jgi:hypothetical protein
LRAERGFYGMTPRLLSRRTVRATETAEYPVMSGLVKANEAVFSARARVRVPRGAEPLPGQSVARAPRGAAGSRGEEHPWACWDR